MPTKHPVAPVKSPSAQKPPGTPKPAAAKPPVARSVVPPTLKLAEVEKMSQSDRIALFQQKDVAAGRIFIELGKLFIGIEAKLAKGEQIFPLLIKAGVRKGSVSNASQTSRVFKEMVLTKAISEDLFDSFRWGDVCALNRVMSGASKRKLSAAEAAKIVADNPHRFDEDLESIFLTGHTMAEADKLAAAEIAREELERAEKAAAEKKVAEAAAAAATAAASAQAAHAALVAKATADRQAADQAAARAAADQKKADDAAALARNADEKKKAEAAQNQAAADAAAAAAAQQKAAADAKAADASMVAAAAPTNITKMPVAYTAVDFDGDIQPAFERLSVAPIAQMKAALPILDVYRNLIVQSIALADAKQSPKPAESGAVGGSEKSSAVPRPTAKATSKAA